MTFVPSAKVTALTLQSGLGLMLVLVIWFCAYSYGGVYS